MTLKSYSMILKLPNVSKKNYFRFIRNFWWNVNTSYATALGKASACWIQEERALQWDPSGGHFLKENDDVDQYASNLSSLQGFGQAIQHPVVFKNRKIWQILTMQHKTSNLSRKQKLIYSVFDSNALCFKSQKGDAFLSPEKTTYTKYFLHSVRHKSLTGHAVCVQPFTITYGLIGHCARCTGHSPMFDVNKRLLQSYTCAPDYYRAPSTILSAIWTKSDVIVVFLVTVRQTGSKGA